MVDEPVSTARAQSHLRVADDDPYVSSLSAYITAARQAVEQFLNATVLNRSRSFVLDGFPCDGKIWLPNGPVISVTSITYVDTAGTNQTVSSYRLTNYPDADLLTPIYGASWPSARGVSGAVTVEYMAGMMTGSPATLADEDITAGILLELGDIWNNREGQFTGIVPAVNPTIANLLYPYRRRLGI